MTAGIGGSGSSGARFRVRTRRVEGAPVVAVRVLLRGGARCEDFPGQALLTGRLLTEGTHRRDWRRLAEEADDRGMVISSSASFEGHGVAIDALASDWRLALEWAAELILESTFPEDRTRWLIEQSGAELASLADQPDVLTGWEFLRRLYGDHPRGRPLQGTLEGLAALEPEVCSTFHGRALAAGGVLAVTGEIDEEEVRAHAEACFAEASEGRLEPAGTPFAAPPYADLPSAVPGRGRVTLEDSDQAHLFVGHLTVPRFAEDSPSLALLSVILGAGAGFTGRIPQRVREREGLAYSAQAQTMAGAGLDPGRLVAYAGTSPRTVEQAERSIRDEISRLARDGVEARELEDARAYLLGRDAFCQETARQWAVLLLESEIYGLPVERAEWRRSRLEGPDLASLAAAAQRHLREDALQVVVGMPPS